MTTRAQQLEAKRKRDADHFASNIQDDGGMLEDGRRVRGDRAHIAGSGTLAPITLKLAEALEIAMRYCEAGAVERSGDESLGDVIEQALAEFERFLEEK